MKQFDLWLGRTVAVGLLGLFPGFPADAVGQSSWFPKDSSVTADLNSVAHNGEIWVAVGDLGTILASQSTHEWIPVTSQENVVLESVTYGGGRFVAVGWGGVVLTSPDGLDWTKQDSGTSSNLWGVAWGEMPGLGQFTAVGDGGLILSSGDGIDWSEEKSGGSTLQAVTFGDGHFVGVGFEGEIVARDSENGDWTAASSGTTAWLQGVAWGNGVYVAVGPEGLILSSPDGLEWQQSSSPVSVLLRGVAFGEGLFQAVGEGGTILSSVDGMGWSVQGTGQPEFLFATVSGAGDWVVVGTGGAIWSTRPAPVVSDYVLTYPIWHDGLGFEFQVEGLALGQTATLQVTEALEAFPVWNDWQSITGLGASNPVSVLDETAVPAGMRFYRLVVP